VGTVLRKGDVVELVSHMVVVVMMMMMMVVVMVVVVVLAIVLHVGLAYSVKNERDLSRHISPLGPYTSLARQPTYRRRTSGSLELVSPWRS
jgi:hypothetical protein